MQEGRIVGTIWPTEDAAPRSVSDAARGARGVARQPLRSGLAAPIAGDASMRRPQISGALSGTTPVTASTVHTTTHLPGTTPKPSAFVGLTPRQHPEDRDL